MKNSRIMGRAGIVVLALGFFASLVAGAGAQTLETVRERGYLVCAASSALPGFAQQDNEGNWSGFDVDVCKAVAAAVFGDATKMEFVSLGGDARFAQLQTGAVDIIARNAPWTMRRDTGYGARYVAPLFFDGLSFMVPQSLQVVSAYELENVSVCAIDGTDELTAIRDFFFENQAAYTEVLYEDLEDLGVAYRAGLCQAVAAPARWLNAIRRSLPEPATHRILPERITKEVLGPVVRQGDDNWFDIVRWAVYTLINAEEVGLTSANLESMRAARTVRIRQLLGLGENYGEQLGLAPDFMVKIIQAVGNYGEIYDRHFGPDTGTPLLRGQNSLWLTGGLIYAPPLDEIQ